MTDQPAPQRFERILAIDSAMNGCGACAQNGERSHSKAEPMMRGQAERLMPLIEEVMAESGLSHNELQAVVVTCGPGAFTGLRIGMATARALALALDIPVYGMSATQALALAYVAKEKPQEPFSVIIETKRTDYYFQNFDAQGRGLGDTVAAPGEEIAALVHQVCIGDAAHRLKNESGAGVQVVQGYDLPDPAVIAAAFIRMQGAQDLFQNPAKPLYLRPPDVSASKKEQRVLAGK